MSQMGYNRALNIMKKALIKKTMLIIATVLISGFFTSCMEAAGFATGYSQGYSSGSRGYTFIGQYSSESACKNACSNKGYRNSYEYYASTANCFCK